MNGFCDGCAAEIHRIERTLQHHHRGSRRRFDVLGALLAAVGQIDLAKGLLHVKRLKNGNASTHPLHGPELRALRKLQRDYPNSPYVFTGERRGPLTASTVRKMVARAGVAAGLEFPTHPHMLRHAAGYKLANDGQDTRAIQHYLGHRNVCHTVLYTNLSPERFKDFWQH